MVLASAMRQEKYIKDLQIIKGRNKMVFIHRQCDYLHRKKELLELISEFI